LQLISVTGAHASHQLVHPAKAGSSKVQIMYGQRVRSESE
jgi:hypothetical protein